MTSCTTSGAAAAEQGQQQSEEAQDPDPRSEAVTHWWSQETTGGSRSAYIPGSQAVSYRSPPQEKGRSPRPCTADEEPPHTAQETAQQAQDEQGGGLQAEASDQAYPCCGCRWKGTEAFPGTAAAAAGSPEWCPKWHR
jgi:hypothetical protein